MWPYLQLPDATNAVKELGFAPAVLLIIILALVAVFGLIVRWLLRKIDEKDALVIRQMDERRADFVKMELSMQQTASALKEGAHDMRSAFNDLAKEIRR